MNRRRVIKRKSLSLDLKDKLISYYKFYYSVKDEITGIDNKTSAVTYKVDSMFDMSGYFGSYAPLKFAHSSGNYSKFAISLWVKLDAGDFTNQYRGIFSSRPTSELPQYGLSIEDKLLIVYFYDVRRYTEAIPAGVWTMITFTVSGEIGTVYINGVKRKSFSYILFPIQTKTYIGCDYLPVTVGQDDRGLRGCLDELAVWGRSLSDSEVLYLYNNGKGNEIEI